MPTAYMVQREGESFAEYARRLLAAPTPVRRDREERDGEPGPTTPTQEAP